MTIEEKLVDMLYNRGLFKNQAVEIVERLKADKATEAMQGRWGEPTDAYPDSLFAVLWLSVSHHALQWIDENCPKAWYRPMFAKDSPPE